MARDGVRSTDPCMHFQKFIVIGAYDNASSGCRVSQTLDNFISGPDGTNNDFPVWIDNKQVFFLVQRYLTKYNLFTSMILRPMGTKKLQCWIELIFLCITTIQR